MRKTLSALLVLGVAAATATVSWSDPAAPAAARLVGLSVAQPDPASEFGQSFVFGQNAGTKLTFRATKDGAVFLGMDEDASKLASFTDDKGTDLSGDDWLWTFPHIPDDKKSCTFEIHSKKAPAAGAREIRLDGVVRLKVGADPKTLDIPGVALAVGTKVTTGPVPFTIEKVGKPEYGDAAMSIDLKSDTSFDAVTAIEFLAPDGHVIESESMGQSSFSMNGEYSVTRTLGLKEAASKVTLRIRWLAKVESVPFRAAGAIGVGF